MDDTPMDDPPAIPVPVERMMVIDDGGEIIPLPMVDPNIELAFLDDAALDIADSFGEWRYEEFALFDEGPADLQIDEWEAAWEELFRQFEEIHDPSYRHDELFSNEHMFHEAREAGIEWVSPDGTRYVIGYEGQIQWVGENGITYHAERYEAGGETHFRVSWHHFGVRPGLARYTFDTGTGETRVGNWMVDDQGIARRSGMNFDETYDVNLGLYSSMRDGILYSRDLDGTLSWGDYSLIRDGRLYRNGQLIGTVRNRPYGNDHTVQTESGTYFVDALGVFQFDLETGDRVYLDGRRVSPNQGQYASTNSGQFVDNPNPGNDTNVGGDDFYLVEMDLGAGGSSESSGSAAAGGGSEFGPGNGQGILSFRTIAQIFDESGNSSGGDRIDGGSINVPETRTREVILEDGTVAYVPLDSEGALYGTEQSGSQFRSDPTLVSIEPDGTMTIRPSNGRNGILRLFGSIEVPETRTREVLLEDGTVAYVPLDPEGARQGTEQPTIIDQNGAEVRDGEIRSGTIEDDGQGGFFNVLRLFGPTDGQRRNDRQSSSFSENSSSNSNLQTGD
ncbi:MAG: hypothetical protein AAF585_20375 [Verrucomicrobiota bacterium]